MLAEEVHLTTLDYTLLFFFVISCINNFTCSYSLIVTTIYFIGELSLTFDFLLLLVESRIKFYSQEIVFLRQDMLYRMRRSCLMPPLTEETNDPFEHVTIFFYIHFPMLVNLNYL